MSSTEHDERSAYLNHVVTLVKKNLTANSRILDIGGGSLRDLRILGNLGASFCVGVDIGKQVDRLSRSLGIEYICADIDDWSLPVKDKCFDLVLMNNVFEHLYCPKRVLKECYRVLRSGGVLALMTPNQARLVNRIRLLAGRSVYYPLGLWLGDGTEHIERRGKRVFAGHIREYTMAETKSVISATGFEIVSSFFYPIPQASPRVGLSKSQFILRTYNIASRIIPNSNYMIAVVATKPN